MVCWPPNHVILTPYPWYFKPPTHGILKPYPWYFDPLPTVYRPPYPWYFDPPTHGIFTPLSMVFWRPYPGYFDPLSIVFRQPYPSYIEPPTHAIFTSLHISWLEMRGVKLPWGSIYHSWGGSVFNKRGQHTMDENWSRGQFTMGSIFIWSFFRHCILNPLMVYWPSSFLPKERDS